MKINEQISILRSRFPGPVSVSLVLSLVLSFASLSFAQDVSVADRGLGANYKKETYLKVPGPPPLARGDFTDIPSQVSLRHFAPSPGDQGAQGSCVGWATAYASRTLISAKANNSSSRPQNQSKIYSPSYIYNQLSNGDCDGGSLISDALELMKVGGVAPLSDFPYDHGNCTSLPTAAQRARASEFRIKGYNRLWGSGHNKHIATRRALATGHPVVIGMGVSNAFMRLGAGDGLYRPSRDDIAASDDIDLAFETGYLGGHAMAVIGYDDHHQGGAFELINSWGRQFGDGGYVWVTYDDFNRFVLDGYEIVPLDPPAPPKVVDMGARVEIVGLKGSLLEATLHQGRYNLDRPMPSGTRFRGRIKTEWPTNIYLIGGDRTGDYVALFPRDDAVEPHASKGATVLLPGPTEDYFTRLNDTVGADFYIILLSQNPLDIASVAQDMKAAGGTPSERLIRVLGDSLVRAEDIEFSASNIGFEAASGEASVVPLVIEIEHVAPSENNGDTEGPLIVLKEPALEAFDAAVDKNLPVKVESRFVRLRGSAQDESAIAQLVVEGALSLQFSSRGAFLAEFELPHGPGPHDIAISAEDESGNSTRKVFWFSFDP